VIFARCGGGVSALALTPQGDFGDLLNLQGFKARFETALRLGPVLTAELYSYRPPAANNKKNKQHPQLKTSSIAYFSFIGPTIVDTTASIEETNGLSGVMPDLANLSSHH